MFGNAVIGNTLFCFFNMDNTTSQIVTETSARSIIKGFTWRLVATFSTIVIAYLITGQTKIALQIGGIEFVAKIAVYYLHERIWLRISFGKKNLSSPVEFEI